MESSDRPDREPDDPEARVITRVRERLARARYSELGRVVTSYRCGLLILGGHLPSQYLRQVAQELIADIDGVTAVVNQIEVRSAAGRSRGRGDAETKG
jgi:osmotically-inducible protein OsmY